MKKRIMLVVLCLSLGVGSSSFAATAQNPGITGIQRSEECGNCGDRGSLMLVKTYSSWRDTGTVRCTKYATKLDTVSERDVYGEYRCSKCGYHQSIGTISKETRVTCTH